MSLELLTHKTTTILLLSLLSFFLAMLLTPVYTHFAYKYKWWKLPRSHAVTGEALEVIAKLRIKRTVPLMAGLVIVAAVSGVTLIFNLNRAQTWLPLAGLVGGGIVGLIDDIINVRGKGGNVAGLRPPIKFALISSVAIVGALLSYLWFNIPPARFFMGDVGSFSLGTALGVVAMLTNTLFLLPLICLVFVAEAGSTLIQMISKKIFHRKVFIASPLHHHF